MFENNEETLRQAMLWVLKIVYVERENSKQNF